jgi:lysophospholipase L1-like esterase
MADETTGGPVSGTWQRTWRAANLLLAGCLAAAIIAVGAELAYRLARTGTIHLVPLQYVSDSQLVYRLNPALPEQRSGFRGGGPDSRERGAALVICLGGSTTFGHAVPAVFAWPHLTGDALLRAGLVARVVNAGVPGYGSRQLLRRYRAEIARLSASYVVVYEGWNRTGPLLDPAAWNPFAVTPPPFGDWLTAVASHSLLVRDAVQPFAEHVLVEAGRWRPDRYEGAWEADMDSLVSDIAAHGQRPMVVIYPSLYHEGMTATELAAYRGRGWLKRPYDPGMLAEIRAKHLALRRIAHVHAATVIDVEAALDTLRGAARLALFLDEWHLSVAGNRRVAELVAGAILSRRSPDAAESSPIPPRVHAGGRAAPGR